MKGIILAGGKGTRLYPITFSTSKQLLPIYDKPLIYYSLSTLMLLGIREILIICNKADLWNYKNLLKNGNHLGINIKYKIQNKPNGIPEAFIIGESFIKNDNVCLILGDNFFYGQGLTKILNNAKLNFKGANIFGYKVNKPELYGIVSVNKKNKITKITEKPKSSRSNIAITGIYFFSNEVITYSKNLKPSKRGELEITDINKQFLKNKKLNLTMFGRGVTWLDTGSFDDLLLASQFVEMIEKRQGYKICCPEEIAWRQKWISDQNLLKIIKNIGSNNYSKYLLNLIKNKEMDYGLPV